MKTFHVGGVSLLRKYKTLDAALAQAQDDDTIEIHKNITFSGKIPHNIILNGNGHVLTVEKNKVGLDCQGYVVIKNLSIISDPRSNGIILHNGGRLEQVSAQIKGPARVLYPTVILKKGKLLADNCNFMRLSAEEGTQLVAEKSVFRDYYGAAFHLDGNKNLSLFSGYAEFKACELDCCYFIGRAKLDNCTIKAFNRSCGDVSMVNCTMQPTVNEPAVNLRKEPKDGPLEHRNETTRFSFEQENGSVTVSGYTSIIPEEFVGFHIINGSLDIKNTANADKTGYHLIRHGSVSFTDTIDAAFYDVMDAKLSIVRSNVNVSKKLQTAMEKLQGLIGLGAVKENLQSIINTISRNKKSKNKDFGFSYHMVFAGDPGTGKTTVAKIVAQALFEIGAVPQNKCTEVAADSLVKGYVGQTAEHVRHILDSALGGVLFIDEAYELTVKEHQNSFNSDVLSVLIRYMEEHRDNLVVIAAGYEKEMQDFLASNIGLTRRFQWVYFPDYTPDEMAAIFESMRQSYEEEYEIKELETLVPQLFSQLVMLYKQKPDAHGRITNGGNGGLVRNVFQQVLLAMNNRLVKHPDMPELITEQDLKEGFRKEMEKAIQV